MSDLKDKLLAEFKEKRPNLSQSSLKTYVSILTSLCKKMEGENCVTFFKNHKKIIEHIEQMEKPQSKKTALSALFVLTGIPEYQEEMNKNIKVVNDFYKEQKNDPERLKKLKSFEEIVAIHDQIKAKYKKNPTMNNRMDLLISYLVSGVLGEELPPRRVLDYANMKIRNFNADTDNYIKAGKFYFNQYKTKDRYGSQIISIPKELNTFINKWKQINEDTDYLLLNEDEKPFTSTALSKKISRMFDGNSMDMLRSIFLSHYYKDMPQLKNMESLASKMGHSVSAALNYYVKSDEK
jgi:hypothetical protein